MIATYRIELINTGSIRGHDKVIYDMGNISKAEAVRKFKEYCNEHKGGAHFALVRAQKIIK